MSASRPQFPPLVTPGDVLREQFMIPLGVSPERLAQDFGSSENTIRQILAGHRRISKTMAHKLHMRFKTTTQFWLNLQSQYDLRKLDQWEKMAKRP
jgi:antitoxin HigA-1